MFFNKRKPEKNSYDPKTQKPVIKCSICNGEQVAGFRDINTGAFSEVCLIRDDGDLRDFMDIYGITGDIEKIY